MQTKILEYLETLLESKKNKMESKFDSLKTYSFNQLNNEIDLLEEIIHEIKNNI